MLFTSEKILAALERWKKVPKLAPVEIGGIKYYLLFMHPRTHYLLKVIYARSKWYHSQWVKRYNKWRASRGEPPYQELDGEFGNFGDVFIKEAG